MLDLVAGKSAGGVAKATNPFVILPGGDGQTVIGVPRDATSKGNPVLVNYGYCTTTDDTLQELQLTSQDQPADPKNGEDWQFNTGGGSVVSLAWFRTNLVFQGNARLLQRIQVDADIDMAFWLDYYKESGKYGTVMGSYHPQMQVVLPAQAFGGALTAQQWGTVGYAPTILPKEGNYAILGAYASALTDFAALRFEHSNFNGFKPGFPVIDYYDTAVANAVLPKDFFTLYQGYQFVRMSEILKTPVCPVFKLGAQGMNLTLWAASISADTPQVTVVLQKVSD